MPERIVVSFCGKGLGDPGDGRRWLERALALVLRAGTLGASVCAFGASSFSFDFATDEIDEAISLAVGAAGEQPTIDCFGIGVSQGLLAPAATVGPLSSMSWGEPLVAAESLARIARAGEVLLDPSLPAARAHELLVMGKRTGEDQGRKIRGLKLDTREPWRHQVAEAVARMEEAELVGREAELDMLVVPVGCIGVIHADRGAGGTRLLMDAMAHLEPSRTLFIAPAGASREPLGAIRNALSRAAALQGAPVLPERLYDALDRLLAGSGADLWLTAELIDRWLGPVDGRFGALAIDDAAEIDTASLEAIAGGLHYNGAFRALARVPAEAALPAPLSTIPIAAEVRLDPLDPAAAERLASRFMAGAITQETARRWARRGAGLPLGIHEALAEALGSGELLFVGARAEPRGRVAGRGKPREIATWIARRARFLPAGEHALMLALCMLGGDASVAMIDALATRIEGPTATFAVAGQSLLSSGWITVPEPGWMKLTSRTIRDVFLGSLDEDARMLWHAETARILEQHGGVLGRADAAFHAAHASAFRSAAKLAAGAARAAMAASLDAAAAALHQFARDHDPEVGDVIAPPSAPVSAPASLPPAPETTRPPPLPPADQTPVPNETVDQPIDPVISEKLERSAVELAPALGGGTAGDSAEVPQSIRAQAAPVSVNLKLSDEDDVTDPEELAERLVALAKQALLQGDIVSLEHLITQLRVTGEHADLVERMASFVALSRGAKDEALGKLRIAAEQRADSPARAARARLAYAVALAHAGRTESALLSALEALAVARRRRDRPGEHACARLLARICVAAGHPKAAAAWAKVAEQATSSGSS